MNESMDRMALVQRLTLADLPGFLVKYLEVPPGHMGLVIDSRGNVQSLPPGRHRVVGLLRRLLGRVSDWRFAVLPGGSFPLRVPVPRLRAGDGGWVDAELLVTLRVADPQRVAAELAVTPADLAAALSAGLEAAARQAVANWAAEDLGREQVAGQLRALLRPALEAQVGALGLALDEIVALSLRPFDEAVDVARKMAELDAALAEVEMERRMAGLESDAEWQQFVHQLETDYGLNQGTLQEELAAAATAGEGAPSRVDRLRQAVRRYVDGQSAALIARLERFVGRRKPPQPPLYYWWERVVPWLKVIGLLVLVAALAIYLLLPGVGVLEQVAAVLELACAVPAAIVLFATALWMERRAARSRSEAVTGGRLMQLGRGDRQRIDQMVRDQLTAELRALLPKMQETRDRAYREQRRDEAVRIKQVEEQADRLRQAVEAKVVGQPVYLTQARVSRNDLEKMLSYDEQLLALAADLGDQAEQLRQAVFAGQPAEDAIGQLQSGLSALDHQFQVRARLIQGAGSSE
ncbi:MAG: SPFH domain-containing protein [Anaerolineae bacterium]|nr:SPFH domain-containing protein [Anaerolineae bacterium]